jgi:eukaryotic-like serine/threonine-protein kinase
VRLLIANSGTNSGDATTVANQVVQAAQSDKTIVGVMGWPFSSNAVKAVQVLNAAHIPMVSETASSDSLTGISKYFFRVAPTNQAQGVAGAHYVEQTLHAKTAALFFDPVDPYSSSLAQDFSKQFTADGNQIVATEKYTVGKPQTLPSLMTDALSHNPDVIYFSGYAADIGTLLTDLPTSGPPVMGGDALYELQGYPSSARATFNHLHFTSFAYPDEWDVQGLTAQKPAFFSEYSQDFDPSGRDVGPYGFTRPDGDNILSYDAMQALLAASQRALTGGNTNFTPDQLQQALTQINGANAIQGVSGQISFGTKGDPVDKAFVILHVSPQGFIQEEPNVVGTFLKPKS